MLFSLNVSHSMVLENGDVSLLATLLFTPLALGLLSFFSVEPRARPWHRTLRKSTFTPPNIAFPTVWLINYLSMGYASYLVVKAWRVSNVSQSMKDVVALMYLTHLLLISLWNPVFMALRSIQLAFFILLAVDILVPSLIVCAANVSPMAAAICVPYFAWLLLCTYLTYYMYQANPGPHFSPTKEQVVCRHRAPSIKTH